MKGERMRIRGLEKKPLARMVRMMMIFYWVVTPVVVHGFTVPTSSVVSQHGALTSLSNQNQYRTNRGDVSSCLKMMEMEDLLFAAQSTASDLASSVLSGSSGNLAVLYVAGLLTSISPCSLGLLPLTVSYISSATGGSSSDASEDDQTALVPTLAYAAGLSTVFCGLGLSVALVGQSIMGSTSAVGPLLANVIALAMGCQLLNIVQLPLPSLEVDVDIDENSNDQAKKLLGVFLLGGSSALIASPCATPVLTTLLAYVATMGNVSYGALLILIYTLGYTTPLLLIGATGGQFLANIRNNSDSLNVIGNAVNPTTAAVLIFYGTNGLLNTLFGDPSLSALTPILQ